MKFIAQYLAFLLFGGLMAMGGTLEAQAGCTDPQAINYDPQAIENDGSCIYPTTNYTPIQVTNLSGNLTECSGLAFFNGSLWTHLDGGNPDQLIKMDTLTGTALATITIPNADNLDWEDLAEDAEHLYIGDFGNNIGNRTDLRIYKVKKSDLIAGTASPMLIEFSYSDQTDFTAAPNANNFDCEAFFFLNDSLHLFSKNWLDFKTRHYVLPAEPGIYVAELRDSLNVLGQVTAADISDEGVALLLGYNTSTSETFMWMLFDFPESDVFSGNKRRLSLGSAIVNSQVEGVVFRDAARGYICSEEFSIIPAKLLAFDITPWLQDPVATFVRSEVPGLSVYPNPVRETLIVSYHDLGIPSGSLLITDLSGKYQLNTFFERGQATGEIQIAVDHLPAGLYWLILENTQIRTAVVFFKA